MGTIEHIHARQILDSRGNPTLEVDVVVNFHNQKFLGTAAVPSGASTGSKEALELRDHNEHMYLGKSVLNAVKNVNEVISKSLIGKNPFQQKQLDLQLLELDGTSNKSKLGANSLLGVSLALSRASALAKQKPLFVYLNQIFCEEHGYNAPATILPAPLMNIINGGAHASNNLDIQEFMILPKVSGKFSDNLQAGAEIFHNLKKILSKKNFSTNVGDEGGFAPNFQSHEEAIQVILQAIQHSGRTPGKDVLISLDCAASEFFQSGVYQFEGHTKSSDEMIQYYQSLTEKYPIYSIEDGLDEADHRGWKALTEKLGKKTVLVGDDLFVTNPQIFSQGIANKEANAILIKVNQIGTLTETFQAIKMAYDHNYKAIISHRSGETSDTFISDLAVATGAGHIKTGSLCRSDRIEKYNQLLRIEEYLKGQSTYHLV